MPLPAKVEVDSKRSARGRHYSGVLVTALPGRFDEAGARLADLRGAEIRETDAASGRFVVVLETADRQGQEESLRALSALPGVAAAALVAHYVEDGAAKTDSREEERP